MKTVTIHEAKTNLSRLIERACRGEEIIISRGSDPVARLVPIAGRKGQRKLGMLKGKLIVGPEFFEPLPPEELDRWE
jgi:prevent-host-death family protein